MIRLLTGILVSSFLAACASAAPPEQGSAPAMVIVSEEDVKVEEAPPHGKIGMSTAWRISDAVPVRAFEFRKRALHPGSAIGLHPINHDEIYYVLSGEGVVHSDGEEQTLTAGMAAYLYTGAIVGIRQVGAEPLVLIIAYPPGD
jgi:mannose-6-phosphate isomerase-like protein (cupin superfamily)|nr:cupin domain-containing protein [Hyphomonas sp. 34-62-18]